MDYSLCLARGALDRVADADVGAAAADVARHGGVDIDVGWIAIGGKQRRSRHDLSGLAITALDDFDVEPGFLYFRACFSGPNAFYGGDSTIPDRADGKQTGPQLFTGEVNRASAALRDAAAEFCAGQAQYVTQHPKQGHVFGCVETLI